MLEAVGAASLDALMDETIPAGIRLTSPLDLPEGQPEHQHLRDLRRARRPQSAVQVLHRPRLLRLHHAERHPAERAREPGLVYAVHAVPGRDRPGPARGSPEFPDHGPRSDRHGDRERVAARRSDRRGRSDDDAVPGAGKADRRRRRGAAVLRRRFVLPADDRRAARPGRAARDRARRRRSAVGGLRRSDVRRAGADAGRSRARARSARVHRARRRRTGSWSPSARTCSASRC